MNFLNKTLLNLKLANVARPRNEKMMERINRGVGNPLKSLIPIYLGQFYQGISEDNNCTEVLAAFASADEHTLDEVNKLYVFWFYWVLDYQNGGTILALKEVQEDLNEIWSIDRVQSNDLAQGFESLAAQGGAPPIYLGKLIRKTLHYESLGGFSDFEHLQNAMTNVLQNAC